MTRRGKRVVLICILITVASAVIIGYGVGKLLQTKDEKIDAPKISEVIEDECTEEYKEEQNVTEVNSTEEKVSSNAILILKKYYIQCDHTINEYVELPQELVNMTKEQVQAHYPDWEVIEPVLLSYIQVQAHYPDWEVIGFEKGKIILYKEFDGVCGEHFKLRVENGKVVIYLVSQEGRESLYEKTNISSEYLTETDLINMQDGLEIYGKEELNKVIEDFE